MTNRSFYCAGLLVLAMTDTVGAAEKPNLHQLSSTACTADYRPVCGSIGGRRQTFGNRCEAKRKKAVRIAIGAC